jgi:hypothetical protein
VEVDDDRERRRWERKKCIESRKDQGSVRSQEEVSSSTYMGRMVGGGKKKQMQRRKTGLAKQTCVEPNG